MLFCKPFYYYFIYLNTGFNFVYNVNAVPVPIPTIFPSHSSTDLKLTQVPTDGGSAVESHNYVEALNGTPELTLANIISADGISATDSKVVRDAMKAVKERERELGGWVRPVEKVDLHDGERARETVKESKAHEIEKEKEVILGDQGQHNGRRVMWSDSVNVRMYDELSDKSTEQLEEVPDHSMEDIPIILVSTGKDIFDKVISNLQSCFDGICGTGSMDIDDAEIDLEVGRRRIVESRARNAAINIKGIIRKVDF